MKIETPAPGIYRDVPIRTYVAWPALDASGCKTLIGETPARYRYERDNPEPRPDLPPSMNSAALELGEAVHAMVLEPDNTDAHFKVLPELNFRKDADKLLWEQVRAENPARCYLRPDVYEKARAMADSVLKHPTASKLFRLPGAAETSVVHATVTPSGRPLTVKIRPDKQVDAGGFRAIVDLKTCPSASADGFSRTVGDFRYDVQAGLYLRTAREREDMPDVTGFIFVAVEKDPPFQVQVFILSQSSAEIGERDAMRGAEIFLDCQESGQWPSYTPDIKEISLPAYLLKRIG